MTLQFQILSLASQALAATVISAGILFLLGLVFEKPIFAFCERMLKRREQKKLEEAKRRYTEFQLRKEAERRKVQRIRDNFNRELENTGTIYIPYYSVS